MTNITIPTEAVKAATAEANAFYPNCYVTRAQIKAAIAAAINAWPRSYSLAKNDSLIIRDIAAIILPLEQEPQ